MSAATPLPSSLSPDAAFFADLPAAHDTAQVFEAGRYRPAPDAALLVVTDIRNSTGAVAEGRHKAVNFVAATAIAALRNLCAPVPIPALFGGDGAVVLVPPELADATRRVLARVRGLAARDYNLDLRVGALPVSELRRLGADVLVGRYEPTPGNHFGVFRGGGVNRLEAAIKGADPALAALASVPPELDDGIAPDLTGLSCRWSELQSVRGVMVTLIIDDAADLAGVYAAIMAVAGRDGDPKPAKLANLQPSWPPKGFWIEVKASGRNKVAQAVKLFGVTLFAWLVLKRGKPIGSFDPTAYRQEVADNTDFSSCDGRLSIVIDCTPQEQREIAEELERQAMAGKLRFGMHLSQTAQMTCLVTSLQDHLHTHFIDGGDGGYTRAAQTLKALAHA